MKTNEFLCGVIEGYYGRPWSFNQRKTLFEYSLRFGLNTYVYAPKDDAKHRSRWRDFYTTEESNELSELIHLAKQSGIHFIYALSPGLDINYSSDKDFTALKLKFDQLSNIGCEHWAILFDDIENEMSTEDKERFPSFAHAQVSLTNQIFDYLNKPNIFIFCPTEYCTRMAKPSLEKSMYLQTIGHGLHPDIEIFWTGPKVVSQRITVSHILSVNSILERRVTIWDNLNANDYDQRRLCLGPFSGRSSSLSSRISGMLINPNCEFELNFIPMNTLGQWLESLQINENKDQIDDDDQQNLQTNEIYQVDKALDQALLQWLPEFQKIKSANDSQHSSKIETCSPQAMSPKSILSSLINDEDSQDSISEHASSSSKIHTMECDANGINCELTLDDVRLLVQLFYLPYENGPDVQQIFLHFYWLRFNYFPHQNLNEWRCRASLFHSHAKDVARLLQKLVNIPNRALLYDIYHYINDINSTINLCSKYLYWIDDDQKRSQVFMSGDVEPWILRGGLAGQFLNILPLGGFQTLIQPELNSSSNIFLIRPMNSNDQGSIYALCTSISYEDEFNDLLNQHPQILAEKILGGYLLNTNDLCFSIDNNDDRLCGFVLTINESEKYDKIIQRKWIEELHQKYPNVDQNFFDLIQCPQWIYDRYSARIQFFLDLTIRTDCLFSLGKKLIQILTNNLSKRGCHGCHALLDERNLSLHQFYLRLGFVNVPTIDQNDHIILLGKQF